jgi:hypothetical protein
MRVTPIAVNSPVRVDDRKLVEQVGLMQVDLSSQMCDPLEVFRARASHDAMDFIPFLQKKFR